MRKATQLIAARGEHQQAQCLYCDCDRNARLRPVVGQDPRVEASGLVRGARWSSPSITSTEAANTKLSRSTIRNTGFSHRPGEPNEGKWERLISFARIIGFCESAGDYTVESVKSCTQQQIIE